MIRLCVFDMDGLLLDSERQVYVHSGLTASETVGRKVSLDFLTKRMGGSFTSYEEKLKEEYGQDYPVKEYWEAYWKIAYDVIENHQIPLRPGAKQILEYCKNHHIQMAIASTSSMHIIECCLRNSEIYHYFDYLISGDMVEHTKPDPEIFLRAIDHFNIPLKEALVLEDGHNGAQAAINGKCRYIVVEDLAYLSEEDKEKSELLPKDLNEVISYIENENTKEGYSI